MGKIFDVIYLWIAVDGSRGGWHISKKYSLVENASGESGVVTNWDQIGLKPAT